MARRYRSQNSGFVKMGVILLIGTFFSSQIKGLISKVPFLNKLINPETTSK